MSMAYIRERYNVPAKRGRVMTLHGLDGDTLCELRITSAAHNIRARVVRSQSPAYGVGSIVHVHPTWQTVYYGDDGGVIMDCRCGGGECE